MKKLVFLLALAAATLCAPARAQEEVEITYQDFYDGLSSYGDWVYVDSYGYCWQPRVEEGWRPYTNGGWVYTDAGWTWSSDEEWGWATDHYGCFDRPLCGVARRGRKERLVRFPVRFLRNLSTGERR